MPPERKMQPARRSAKASVVQAALAPEAIAKRTKRHLDELERSNYAEPTASLIGVHVEDNDEGGGRTARGKAQARQTISDKKSYKGLKKKKATMNVRTAILYKKSFAVLLEESGITNSPPDMPTYITAVAPPPKDSPRLLCTVCGYWGRYKCRRCALSYCDKRCEDVHNETRCERRII